MLDEEQLAVIGDALKYKDACIDAGITNPEVIKEMVKYIKEICVDPTCVGYHEPDCLSCQAIALLTKAGITN